MINNSATTGTNEALSARYWPLPSLAGAALRMILPRIGTLSSTAVYLVAPATRSPCRCRRRCRWHGIVPRPGVAAVAGTCNPATDRRIWRIARNGRANCSGGGDGGGGCADAAANCSGSRWLCMPHPTLRLNFWRMRHTAMYGKSSSTRCARLFG